MFAALTSEIFDAVSSRGRPTDAIWNARTQPSRASQAADVELPRRHDERARVDFPARLLNTWLRTKKAGLKRRNQSGGLDGDFTQDAAQESRGRGRRIEF